MSIENWTWPGMTLVASGQTSKRPTVATRSASLRARASIASAISAAAVSASRRKAIGVAPACPATPSTPTSSRDAPLIAVTIPSGRPSASRIGPCSICASTNAATPLRRIDAGLLRIAAEGFERLAHRDAGRVPLVERVLGIGPRERARAGERGAEANALLVAESDDLDRMIETLAAPGQGLDHGQRSQRAIVSIVAPGVAHGVDMRAQHQRWRARALALVAGDDIAGGVDPRLEPGLAAPTDENERRASMGLREEEPRQAAGLIGEGGECVEPRHQPPAGGEIGVQYFCVHQFCAVSTPSQRASVLRSSSVIWLKLLGGMAWVRTACCLIAAAKRAICSGVSRSTPFGASPIQSIG